MDEILPEVIIASSNGCAIYDCKSGNCIASYHDKRIKDTVTFVPKTLSLIGQDLLIAAYSNKPVVKIWKIKKEAEERSEMDFVVPGMVSALTVSKCGTFCVAGIKEQIFIWNVSTGHLLNVLGRHYQSITCLKFTDDDSCFLSGGKDGHVIVWGLSSVVDVSAYLENIKPQFVWTQHSAEVTDIYCGNRIATTSLDMTCKVYEQDSGILLSSICMDVPLTSVVMDTLDNIIFLGDERGYVYKIQTYERLPHEIHRADVNNKVAIQLHETKVISLHVSFDGTCLVTASEDGSCKLWDIQSMACLLNFHTQGPLTNAFLALQPACLTNKDVKVQLPCQPFCRDLSGKTEKKYIDTTLNFKELSLMYDGCPDKIYAHSVFCSEPAIKYEAVDAAAVNDAFTHNIHGETISDMTVVNQHLFAYALDQKLEDEFFNPSSPS